MLYVVLYASGHFLVQTLRVDQAFLIGDSFSGELLVSGALALFNPRCATTFGPSDDFSSWAASISCPMGEDSDDNLVVAICIS